MSLFVAGIVLFAVFATSVVGGAAMESMVEVRETQQEVDGIDDEAVAELKQTDNWVSPIIAVFMQPLLWTAVELGKFGVSIGYAHPTFAKFVGEVTPFIIFGTVGLMIYFQIKSVWRAVG